VVVAASFYEVRIKDIAENTTLFRGTPKKNNSDIQKAVKSEKITLILPL